MNPYQELCQEPVFDAILTNTSLTSSIMAAHLSKDMKKRVLVASKSSSYGDPLYSSDIYNRIEYKIDASPLILSSSGKLVDELLETEAAKYIRFEAIKGIIVVIDGRKILMPLSKEQIMLSKDFSLTEKRLLMRAIQGETTATGEQKHSLDLLTNSLKKLVIAMLGNPSNLQYELTHFVQGLGRFKRLDDRCSTKSSAPSTPFLVPIYGASDVIQAFCRTAAVYGTIFVLGQSELDEKNGGIEVKSSVDDGLVKWNASGRILSLDSKDFTYTVVVLITNIALDEPSGCYIYRILNETSLTNLLQLDSSTNCCPQAHYIYYAWSHDNNLITILEQYFDFNNKDESKPPVIWWHQFKVPEVITSACAEKALFNDIQSKVQFQ